MTSTPARARALAALFASTLAVAACGGSDEANESPVLTNEAPATTESAEAETTTSTVAAADEDSTDEGSTDEDSTDEAGEAAAGSEPVRPEVVTAPLTAGPLSVTPTNCVIEGTELVSSDGSPSSLAFAGERAFVATPEGILAFAVSTDAGCTLTLDTSIGEAGVLHPEEVDSLSGNAGGRLVAGDVFGMTVFDIEPGFSYSCDGPNGQVSVSPDGTQAVGVFPTSTPELWSLTDTICNFESELVFDELADVKYIAFDGADFLVGGEGLDEVVYGTRYSGTTETWRAGTGEIGAPGWFGWIHGMAPCGAYTCIVDTNTFQLALVDGTGAIVAGFDLQDGVGVRGWVEPIVQGPDGANYVLISTTYDDEASGERTYFGEVVRLDVAG